MTPGEVVGEGTTPSVYVVRRVAMGSRGAGAVGAELVTHLGETAYHEPPGRPALDRETARRYGLERRSVQVLAARDQAALGSRIERGEKAVLAAVLSSPVAIRELLDLGERLRRGELQVREIFEADGRDEDPELEEADEVTETEGAPDLPKAEQVRLDQVLEHIDRIRQLEHEVAQKRGALRTEKVSEQKRLKLCREIRAIETKMTKSLGAIRLDRKQIDRIASKLEALIGRGEEAEVPVGELRRTCRDIRDGLRKANRARTELFEAHLHLVASVAKNFTNRGLQVPDLIQEGTFGLLTAMDKFEYRRGYLFATFAVYWIRRAIRRAIAEQARTIRVPAPRIEATRELARASDRLEQQLGRDPTAEELAEATELPLDQVRRALEMPTEPISFETPIDPSADYAIGDFIEDHIEDESVFPTVGLHADPDA